VPPDGCPHSESNPDMESRIGGFQAALLPVDRRRETRDAFWCPIASSPSVTDTV